MNQENKTSGGAMIASVIIVIILLVGGVYSLKNRPMQPQPDNIVNNQEDSLAVEQNTSTELPDLEKDADIEALEDLTADLDSLDATLTE